MKRSKVIIISVLCLALGLYAGFQLPRGAGLVAAVTGLSTGDENPAYIALDSHQALLEFQQTLDETRQMVLREARSEQEAIEGMRWILRVIGMSTHIIADANPAAPRFQRMDTWVRKLGGDNPYGEYYMAGIDGRYNYRITGNMGDVQHLSFTVNAGQGASPRRRVGYHSDKNMVRDDNGDFEIVLNRGAAPGDAQNWVQIPEDASAVMVRVYMADRSQAKLPQLAIEIEGGNPAYAAPTDDEIALGIRGTSFGLYSLTRLHRLVTPELLDEHNAFIRMTPENLGGDIASEDNLYMLASYQIDDGTALLITLDPPETRYWNLTLESRWHEINEYLNRPVSRTLAHVTKNDAGEVEFLVSHENPGHPNWMDTSSHDFGFLTLRWLDVDHSTVALPRIKVITLDELEQHSTMM